MKKIIVKIEIEGIKDWNVDWENDKSAKNELTKLNEDITYAISKYCGIGRQNITATLNIENCH